MNYLLDTHVWLWSLLEPAKLNLATRAAFTNSQNNFFLSPITLWETMILIEKKRLLIQQASPEVWLKSVLQSSGVQETPLTSAVALRSRLLQLPHQDPADRFIAATAVEYDLILMTADQHLLNSSELTTWSVL